MFKQLFAAMNETLDEVMRQYPTADIETRQALDDKLNMLKAMSDSMIELWLQFEERLSAAPQTQHSSGGDVTAEAKPSMGAYPKLSPEAVDLFKRGQGYFQLYMFDKAIPAFEETLARLPDYLPARLYLAMGHLRLGNDAEAYRHFKLITSMADQAQMKAVSYNAMGCILAKNDNMDQAQQLFKLAYATDPSCVQPMINMGICLSQSGGTAAEEDGWIS